MVPEGETDHGPISQTTANDGSSSGVKEDNEMPNRREVNEGVDGAEEGLTGHTEGDHGSQNGDENREQTDEDEAVNKDSEDDEEEEEEEEEGEDDEEEEEEEEEEEDEDESSDDNDDDDEESEPKFKYSRPKLPQAMFSDAVSTSLVTDSFFVFATHTGVIYILDNNLLPLSSYRAHSASVLALSTDGKSYVGSASMDGTVVIRSLLDSKDVFGANFQRPVHALALDPNYATSKAFISGGMAGKMIYSERNWLGRRLDTVISPEDSTDDTIISTWWAHPSLIVWMTQAGIFFYSKVSKSVILQIPRPESTMRADLYNPRVCMPESNRIYVGWADTLWTFKLSIEKQTPVKSQGSHLKSAASVLIPSSGSVLSLPPEPKVELENTTTVPWLIGGLASYNEEIVAVLGYLPPKVDKSSGRRLAAPPPELKLYDLESNEEIYADVLSMNGFERLGVNDYHLGQHSATTYYIVSAKDAVVATKRDLKDRLEWHLQHNQYEDAWTMSENIISPQERAKIGIQWVESIVSQDASNEQPDWSRAAQALKLVLNESIGQDMMKQEWDTWGWIFIKSGKIDVLTQVIPIDLSIGIDPNIYSEIIAYYVDHDQGKLLSFLRAWPVDLYDSEHVKRLMELKLEEHEGRQGPATQLTQALATVYVASDDPVPAVHHLLRIQDASVVKLISDYSLLPQLVPQIPDIMTVNLTKESLKMAPIEKIRESSEETVELVAAARHQVLPSTVLEQLTLAGPEFDIMEFLYLEKLSSLDPFASREFGDMQVKLYAEFDRPKLLSFIQKNTNYNLGSAVQICETNNYIPELVYLLGKVGQNKRALKLIIEDLKDPERAIEFVTTQKDRDLWNDLIEYSIDKPNFLRILLDKGRDAIDPITILKEIPDHIQVPGFKSILLDVFMEKDISLSISKDVLEIMNSDAQKNSKQLREGQTRGHTVAADSENETHDFSQTLIVVDDDLVPEKELIGEVYTIDHDVSGVSVKKKIDHLLYILRHLPERQ